MSVLGIIILVVVVVAILVALLFFLPSLRERARVRRREFELRQRRKQAVSEHREEADRRERRAEAAEQRARIAEQEAERERAEAQLRQERAELHERGMADHELVADDERERFAGTSAVPGAQESADAAVPEEGEAASVRSRTDDVRDEAAGEQTDDGGGLLDRFRQGSSDEPAARR